jgi:nucleoside diphosphate kinase
LGYRKLLGSIYNHFENQNGNKGINIKFQGLNPKELRKFYNDLYTNELNRIPKLEKLLRDRGIEFDF